MLEEGSEDIALGLFKGLARSYDLTLQAATLFQDRYWKRWLVHQASIEDGEMILDVGAGTLVLEQYLERTARSVVALDLTDEMLRAGKAKELGNVLLLVRGDAVSLPFPDESYDLIVSCYVPKYVSADGFAGELSRTIRPGGRVVVYDFSKPRGVGSPIVWAYLLGLFPVFGRLLGWAKRREAMTFKLLPRIIRQSRWDDEFPKSMQEHGFQTVAVQRLTSGVVTGYAGRKERLDNPASTEGEKAMGPQVRKPEGLTK